MNVNDVVNHKGFQIGGVGVGCFAAGAALGYFYAMSKIQDKIVEAFEESFDEDLEMSLPLEWDDDSEDNWTDSHLAHTTAEPEHILVVDKNETDDEPEILNVFTRSDPWDYAAEEIKRENSNGIYILHRDEFFADEQSFTQLTFNYYAKDDILVDEDDKPVHNYKDVVGELGWGYGSLDPNVFYSRNENLREEYEVLYNDEFYSVEILGYNLESVYEEEDGREKLMKFKDE